MTHLTPDIRQVDEEPAIRANTTILLGNLASHLSEPACKRVLLNAFARALKDGFPPSRIAGLKVSADEIEVPLSEGLARNSRRENTPIVNTAAAFTHEDSV